MIPFHRKSISFAIIIVATFIYFPVHACGSGPDFCPGDARIPKLLLEKKTRLLREYPSRIVSLLDIGVQCVARINQSPDGFSILAVESAGVNRTYSWSQDNEDAAKKEIESGTLSHVWVINARRAFACDGEKPYDQRPDYIVDDDVNSSLAIKID